MIGPAASPLKPSGALLFVVGRMGWRADGGGVGVGGGLQEGGW